MKSLLLTLTSLLLTLSGHAQGTVEFANDASTAVSNILTGAPVPAGNTFLVQLFYGPAGTSPFAMISVSDAPIGFAQPGIFSGGTRTAPLLPGGTTGSFQVRAWEASLGADWYEAFANYVAGNPGGLLGQSDVFEMTVANPLTVPLQPPTSLVTSGFKGFYVQPMPEPSSLALGALGLAVLLWRWRKTI